MRPGFGRAVWLWVAALLAALSPGSPARAEDDLLTDRPDFTETSVAVTPGRFQLEGGSTYLAETDLDAINGPETLLRIGVLRGLELRLGMNATFPQGSQSSLNDVSSSGEGYVGLKLQLAPADAPLGLALIPAVTGPLWKDEADEPEATSQVVMAWSRSLSEPWSMGGMAGAAFADETTLGATVVLGRSLGDRWGAFLEWAGESTDGEGTSLLHHGYTFGLGPNVQLDAHIGLGMDDRAPDWFVGAGFAIRR